MDNPLRRGMKRKAAEETERKVAEEAAAEEAAALEAKRLATLDEIHHTLEEIKSIIESIITIKGFVLEYKHDLSTHDLSTHDSDPNPFIFKITDNNENVVVYKHIY